MKYFLFPCMCLMMCCIANAQTITARYGLPLRSDFAKFFYSNMAIEFSSANSTPIELENFFKSDSSEFANALKRTIKGIDRNSIAGIERFCEESIDSNNSPSKIIQWLNKNFKMLRKNGNLLLLKEVVSHNQVAYFCGIKMPNRYIVCVFPVYKTKNGIFWYWSPNGALSSYALICCLFQENMLKPITNNNYKYSCPGKFLDSDVIKIKFNGEKCNIDINNDYDLKKTSYLYSILNLYKKYYKAGDASIEQCAPFYTDISKKRFLAWIQKDPVYAKDYINRSRNKIITFVMDANPMYIVFYRRNDSKAYFDSWDYIIKTETGLKFTNLGCYDVFHHFLEDNVDDLQKVIYGVK